LKKKGAILAEDMTVEAVIAKLSYILGKGYKGSGEFDFLILDIKAKMLENIRGEITSNDDLTSLNFKRRCSIDRLFIKDKPFIKFPPAEKAKSCDCSFDGDVEEDAKFSSDNSDESGYSSLSVEEKVTEENINDLDENGQTKLHRVSIKNK
jgi:hypothetical protein